MTLNGTQTQGNETPAQVAQPKEVLQPGPVGTIPGKEGTTEINEGQQYGGADVKKILRDALAADGREQKDRADKAETEVKRLTDMANGLTTQVNTVSSQMTELLRANDDAEAATIKDDPAALTSLRVRQANRTEALRLQGVNAEYEARNTKLAERETATNAKETSVSIKLVAMATGVDEKALADLVPDGHAERLTKAANILKLSGNAGIDPVTNLPKPAGLTQTPASPMSAGGGETGIRQIIDKAKKRAGVGA